MPHAISYCRVSTLDQAQSGIGLDAQSLGTERYFDLLATKIPGLSWSPVPPESNERERPGRFVERGVSAFKVHLFKRPIGRQLLTALKPGDHLLFARLDRAFRSTKDFANTYPVLQDMGVIVHFVDLMVDMSTPNGELVCNLMVSIAQWQSRYISERAKESARQRRAKQPRARTVQAFQNSGDTYNVASRAKVVRLRWILQQRLRGLKTGEIARKLWAIECRVRKQESRYGATEQQRMSNVVKWACKSATGLVSAAREQGWFRERPLAHIESMVASLTSQAVAAE